MMQHTFLVEITTEELPPKILRNLAENFAIQIDTVLNTSKIKHGKIKWFATPRRIAVLIINMHTLQDDSFIEKRGPSFIHSFDSTGNPTIVAKKWANKYSIQVNQAEYLTTSKGKWLIHRIFIKGKLVETLLCDVINNAINKLSNFKMMYWNDKKIKFVRPVRNVILLLDDKVISGSVLGIKINRIIFGHRFMGESKIYLEHANEYLQTLQKKGKVIADYYQRQKIITHRITTIAKHIGGVVDFSNSLLEEVTSSVEWPVVLYASFKKDFLAIPLEVLVYTMKVNQKYFPIYDVTGNLLPYFIFVVNIESKDIQSIIIGNKRVIHARFTDAEFCFKIDQKKRLIDYLLLLKNLLFQEQLGTMYDKSKRISSLSTWLAKKIGANIEWSTRAGLLCKCDLMTKMVLEFPSMQGIIGMYYAYRDNEPQEVALAQKEHYQPRLSGDELPTTLVSCTVAIADKIDTLVGILGNTLSHQNDNDPFSLRRFALGILRIIIEKKLSLDLYVLVKKSISLYNTKLINVNVVNDVVNFIFARLRSWYQDKKHDLNIIQLVLDKRPTQLIEVDARIQTITNFYASQDFIKISAIIKRIANIISQHNKPIHNNLCVSLLTEPDEIKLNKHLIILEEKIKHLLNKNLYQDAIKELVIIYEPLDIFFKNIFILTKNIELQTNRIILLNKIYNLFLQVIDISLLS